ncbi:MAG: BatD family protein [Thiothrix sp.]|uniref:BatD family protein n=1 Tax=Thiothrix sp. TaxID=1032 RepID=UPI002618FA50|nr:BatD family protein [Thiothrix sp.]MDD5393862.1 BatD family protein [Thiothrix sp.]
MVRFLLLVLFWLSPLWVQAASITAQFDRNPVALGDPVTLTFTANGVVDSEPDFSPLQQDFEIRGRSQSNSFNMINGVSSVQTLWELNLYPRNTGTLKIPPIQFGGEQCQVPELQVLDQPPPTAGGTDDDILIELEAEPKQPYVQQQTIITQRMLHIAPLQQQATLSHPPIEAGKGNIQQIGSTRNTTMMRNGRNYQVIERRYALFPQQSGELTLGRTAFEGILAEPGPNSFDPFGISGKRIRRFSQPMTLQIQTQPAAYNGKQWLPAQSITLNAHWQTPVDKLKAGEPVTLTLAIVAEGLAAEQLPKLEVQAPAGIKAYTDQPELRNETNNDGIIGVRQEKWVIVVPYNGEYELPPITLDWWNIATGKQETAQVNAVKMHVSGGQVAPAGATPPSPVSPQQQASAPAAAAPTPVPPASTKWSLWEQIAAILLLLWSLLSLGWLVRLWQQKQRNSAPKTAVSSVLPPKADARVVLRQLEQACRQNQAQAAHDALLQWMDVGLNIHPALVSALREQAAPALQAELDTLNTALFGRDSSGWKGAALWQAIQTFKPATQVTSNDSGLAELYPD